MLMAHRFLIRLFVFCAVLSASAAAQVSFSVNDVSAEEGEDLVFTITKTGDDGLSHDVDYDANHGTATNSDYYSVSGTLTFTPSQTTQTVTVTTKEDYDEEPDETITLDLDDATNGATISDDQGIGTIVNDDGAAAPVQFTVNDVSAEEGEDLVFTVTKTGDDGLSHSVDYDAKNGTATGSDFDDVSGTLTFSPSTTSLTVAVPTVEDTKIEGDETVELELDNATNGANIADDIGVGTILDNDSSETPPTFAIDDVSATEGGNLVFTVTKTGTVTQSYSVDFATADGTATAGSDYTAQSNTLLFASSDTTKTITVSTTDDSSPESAETVLVNLSNATSGSSVTDSQGVGTINDNDSETPPTFAISDASSVTEGGDLVFTVTKTGTVTQSYSVDFATADGTATAGSDYTAQSGTLTFTSSDTTKTITVSTTDDSSQESDETVLVNLSNATGGSSITDSQGAGTINDNDSETPPSFAIDDVSATEGGDLVFTVTKTGTVTQSYSVDFATADGAATAGSDYTAQSNTLTFLSSDTTKSITVATIDDSAPEESETVLVNLSSPSDGATITDTQGTGTINDNDQEASFSINDVTATEGGNLVFTITKTGSTSTSYSVDFATADGTATAGSDYTTQNGTRTFATGETSKTVTVATSNDSTVEGSETVLVNLSNPSSGASITDGQGVGVINDNDGSIGAEGYEYDVLARLIRVDFVDGSHFTFSHDASGNRDEVTAVNDPPVAYDDSFTMDEDDTRTYGPTGNDEDPNYDDLEVVSVTSASHGFVGIDPQNSTQIIYSPTNNYNGPDSFDYTVSDGSSTDTATITVTVTPVNDAPVANNDAFYGIDMNNWTTLDVKGGGDSSPDYDVDGDVFTITSVTEGAGDVEIINGGHAVRYRCQCALSDDVFSYTISDGNGGTDTASVAVFGGIDPQSVEE